MGLDWNPGPKPRQGSESEFRELWAALQSRWCWDRSGKRKKFQELTITAFETLAAPRVGFDDAATRWAHQAFSDRADKAVSEDEFVRGLNGLYVLDLVPPCDGIPRYTNGDAGGYVERYSFRGQFLADCVGIIGQELFDQAYRSKMPENTGRYGEDLIRAATAFAVENGVDISTVSHTDDLDSIEFQLDVVMAAGKWCRFWSERGHWLHAYW